MQIQLEIQVLGIFKYTQGDIYVTIPITPKAK